MTQDKELLYQDLSYTIRGVAFDVYKEFRNSHKEKVCHRAFIVGLREEGLNTESEKRIPIYYKGKKVGVYIPDVIVEEKILIELKSKKFLTKQDKNQFWHYLTNSEYKLGFLINFGRPDGVEIIRRIYTAG